MLSFCLSYEVVFDAFSLKKLIERKLIGGEPCSLGARLDQLVCQLTTKRIDCSRRVDCPGKKRQEERPRKSEQEGKEEEPDGERGQAESGTDEETSCTLALLGFLSLARRGRTATSRQACADLYGQKLLHSGREKRRVIFFLFFFFHDEAERKDSAG